MFTVINPGSGNIPSPNTSNPEAPKAGENTVPLDEALKGGEHTKVTGFSVTDYSAKPGGAGAAGSSVALGGLLQGKVVVELMDSFLPAIIVILFKKMKLDARKSQFQLSEKEKGTLAPIVEACLNSINLDFSNPWTTLGVCLVIMYGSKAMEVGGVQKLEQIAGEGQPLKDKPAPVVVSPLMKPGAGAAKPPMHVVPPAATDNDKFTSINPGQPTEIPWGENELQIVMRGAKKNREKATDWLNRNWKKYGYTIPQRYIDNAAAAIKQK